MQIKTLQQGHRNSFRMEGPIRVRLHTEKFPYFNYIHSGRSLHFSIIIIITGISMAAGQQTKMNRFFVLLGERTQVAVALLTPLLTQSASNQGSILMIVMSLITLSLMTMMISCVKVTTKIPLQRLVAKN